MLDHDHETRRLLVRERQADAPPCGADAVCARRLPALARARPRPHADARAGARGSGSAGRPRLAAGRARERRGVVAAPRRRGRTRLGACRLPSLAVRWPAVTGRLGLPPSVGHRKEVPHAEHEFHAPRTEAAAAAAEALSRHRRRTRAPTEGLRERAFCVSSSSAAALRSAARCSLSDGRAYGRRRS